MNATILKGKAHVYGDNIDTDAIIPGKYTKTLDLQTFADHVLEDLDPGFRSKVRKGDILVAGDNFGCGSSREQAPLALKVAGVSAVVAKYFARIFFRNAVNIGLPALEIPDFEILPNDELEIDLKSGIVKNLTKNMQYRAAKMPQTMIDIVNEGGLVNYLRKYGDYRLESKEIKIMSNGEQNLPLTGIKVLAFTHAVMGPAAGLILADLGAEVIHIEPPTGDATRRLRGFGVGYFPFFNRNKKSLAIDLKAPEGKEIILKLVATADIVLENFGPGTIERLGYGYEALSNINPGLIYVSLKGFLPGPYEHRVAMDEVVQMMGGLAYMTGPPGQPLRAGSSIIDVSGGMFGAMGAITALYDRKRTGKGTYIKGALFETTAFIMGQHMAYAAIVDDPVPPMPARVSAWSVYKLFETKDEEQVFIGIISEKHWQKFCEAFDRLDWLADERLQTNNNRIQERDWFLPAVDQLIKQFTKAEVIEICDTAGICFAPIARPEDLFDDPQLNQGDYGLLETEFPGGEKTKMPRLPLQFGSYNLKKRNDPPAAIGADTREVLESLGYDENKISELAQKNIVAIGATRR